METKTIVRCDKCKSTMVERENARGKFYGCSTYPICKATKPIAAKATTSFVEPEEKLWDRDSKLPEIFMKWIENEKPAFLRKYDCYTLDDLWQLKDVVLLEQTGGDLQIEDVTNKAEELGILPKGANFKLAKGCKQFRMPSAREIEQMRSQKKLKSLLDD